MIDWNRQNKIHISVEKNKMDMDKKALIEKIKKESRQRLSSFGYTEEQMAFLNDIIDVKFFRGKPSRIVLKDGMELYL